MTEPESLPDPAPVTPEPAVVAEGAPESAPPAGDLAEIKRVLEAALTHAAFDGWSRRTLQNAAADCGFDKATATRLFPQAMLLPAVSAWRKAPRWGRIITFISIVSYALYLVHQPVRCFFNRWFAQEQEAGLLVPLLLYWIACITLSWLVQRYWERRFMNLRDGIGRRLGIEG